VIPIDSTAIARVGYDDARRVLSIEYRNGRTYDYFDVPAAVYMDLLSAASAGEFINLEIKPNYDCIEAE